MLTIAIFTYKRIKNLNKCLKSIDSKNVSEILIFNDDEKLSLTLEDINIDDNNKKLIKIFNPQDFNFKNRAFRKPIYLNKAVSLCQNEFILFSDDDGIFSKGAINQHVNALSTFDFSAGGVIRSKFFSRISTSILQGTNYAFRKSFFKILGGYDEIFSQSMGGGDVDFWYRIYNYSIKNNSKVAFLPNAIQTVKSKSTRTRNKKNRGMDSRIYTMKKHNLKLKGPMYKWFQNIRNKYNWMEIIK